MKTAMKKLFSLMLVTVLLIGVMPFQAFADGVPYYQIISPNEGNKVLVTEGLEAGKAYNVPSDFTIPEGYEFDYALKHHADGSSPVSGAVEVAEGEILHLFVNIKQAPPVCEKCGSAEHDATAHCAECGEVECVCCDVCHKAECICRANVIVYARASDETNYADGTPYTMPVGVHSATEIFNAAKYSGTVLSYSVTDGNGANKIVFDETINMVAGSQYILWLELAPTAATPDPAVCSVCGAENLNGMCTGCYLEEVDCTCNQTTTPENNRGKVDLILDYNYRGAKDTTMKVERDALIIDLIAGIPAPTRDGHLFSHWTMDEAGEDLIDTERVTSRGTKIYAQWDDDLAIGGKITIKVNLNYDRKMADPVTNITKGTRMGDVLDYVSVPTRWNHKFVGWYWDRDCTDPVEAGDKVYRNDEIFAKWEKRKTNNEIMLKIYLNGDTKSVAKIVDMYDYAKDGEISMSEVKEVVKKYYSAKNSDGMSFIGLFEADEWSDFVRNHKHNRGSNHIDVNRHDDTTIYVMVVNAKVATPSSSGTPDSSNPKTGDMIFMPAIVLGLSASALAVMFYLNKKRAY